MSGVDRRIKIGSLVEAYGGYFVILAIGDLALSATTMYHVDEVESNQWALKDIDFRWHYKRDLTIEEMLTHDNRLIRRLGEYVRCSH